MECEIECILAGLEARVTGGRLEPPVDGPGIRAEVRYVDPAA